MDILAGRTAYISGGIISTINHCLVENSTINGYVTKGDANELPDDYIVSSSDIVGQYVALIPILGNVLTLLSSSMGFLLIIVLSLLAFFIYQLTVFLFLKNPATLISIQPFYRDRIGLLGYFNEFAKRFNETEFLISVY
jgi:hypothetical protein